MLLKMLSDFRSQMHRPLRNQLQWGIEVGHRGGASGQLRSIDKVAMSSDGRIDRGPSATAIGPTRPGLLSVLVALAASLVSTADSRPFPCTPAELKMSNGTLKCGTFGGKPNAIAVVAENHLLSRRCCRFYSFTFADASQDAARLSLPNAPASPESTSVGHRGNCARLIKLR